MMEKDLKVFLESVIWTFCKNGTNERCKHFEANIRY